MEPAHASQRKTETQPQWIWFEGPSSFGILRQELPRPAGGATLTVQCAAFDRYELYLDGKLALEGPLPGDLPRWIPVDETELPVEAAPRPLVVDIVVYHSGLDRIHYRGESQPGFWGIFTLGPARYMTGPDWQAAAFTAWRQPTPRMNHVLDPLEEVDRRGAQWSWRDAGSRLCIEKDFAWGKARAVALPNPLAGDRWSRTSGFVSRSSCAVRHYRVGRMEPPTTSADMLELASDSQRIALTNATVEGPLQDRTLQLADHNVVVADLGEAVTGMPWLEVKTPTGLTVDLGWSERVDDRGVPVLYSKGTHYVARFHVPAGRHTLKPFHWSGFRHLLIVCHAEDGRDASIQLSVSGIRRALKLPVITPLRANRSALGRINALCRRTLEQTLPEYPADCPTREKAHYWIDGLFIGLALEKLYGLPMYMDWYQEAFRRVPLQPGGLFSSVYPGRHRILADACLLPVIGWRYMQALRGELAVEEVRRDKALAVRDWYECHLSPRGLVEPPGWKTDAQELIFLDHPGLPWHQVQHAPLDRRNPSAALNLYYLLFLQSLHEATSSPFDDPEQVRRKAELARCIRNTFWDGRVLRDCAVEEHPDAGTSWLANALGVIGGVLEGEEAVEVMRRMVAGYEQVCRCTPGTLFWFLQALSLTGLEAESETVLIKLFTPMLEAGATATWETFEGNIEDSLCHPWLAAPVALYLDDPAAFAFTPRPSAHAL